MNEQSRIRDDRGSSSSESSRRKGSRGKRASVAIEGSLENVGDQGKIAGVSSPSPGAPCGACKFLRRKCIGGCIFAPHFGSDQGAARFAAVHKVFGASNVSKILLHIPENSRNDAVITISYEAQARLSDPIYGCVSTILALQQQVASLQAELALVQTQLMNCRYAMANALQDSQVIQQQQIAAAAALQPAYSNTSSISNNLMNINSGSNCCNSNFELVGEAAAPSYGFDPVHHHHHLSHHHASQPDQVEEEDEEESQNPLHFANQMFQQDKKHFL